jgi:circadian clock protein KaiB
MKIKRTKVKSDSGRDQSGKLRKKKCVLSLYIVGRTTKSLAALNNLRLLCSGQLKGKYTFEVIDLLKNPRRARENQIVAVPTLVRRRPLPMRNIIGDLSDSEQVLGWIIS